MNLCAFDDRTGKFVTPMFAKKYDDNGVKNTFSCVDPSCNGRLKLRNCVDRVDHFAHVNSGDCSKYSRTIRQESEDHLEAKRQLKMVFENGFNISIKRTCPYNNQCSEIIVIPPISNTASIEIEYHFNFNGGSKYADVVYLDGGGIKYIFEIYNTSETHEYNRPDPWFEIDAKSLLNIIQDVESDKNLLFFCLRKINCNRCITSKLNSELGRCFENKKRDCFYKAEKIRLQLIADEKAQQILIEMIESQKILNAKLEKEKLERVAKNESDKAKLNNCRMCNCPNYKDTWSIHYCTNRGCDCYVVRIGCCYKCGDKKYGRKTTQQDA